MGVFYRCDICKRELEDKNHSKGLIDGIIKDICRDTCWPKFIDMKRELDLLGKQHTSTYEEEAKALKERFLGVGNGQT